MTHALTPSPDIVTPRILMRRWHAQDREAFAVMCADPLVMRYFTAALSKEEACAFVDRIERHFDEKGFGLWALERRHDGKFLGFTGLYTITADCPVKAEVEVGWRLAREFWGQGLVTEAARASIEFGFRVLSLRRIVSITAKINARSRRVMERLGMERAPELDFDHPLVPSGHELGPQVVYCISRPVPIAEGAGVARYLASH